VGQVGFLELLELLAVIQIGLARYLIIVHMGFFSIRVVCEMLLVRVDLEEPGDHSDLQDHVLTSIH